MKAREWKNLGFFVLLLALAMLAGYVGNDDLGQRQYCNNVRDGVWPDFRKTYLKECGGKEPPKFNEALTK